MRVLVIAAHPDDETLGCGGTMARHIQDGHEVRVVIVGEGITSRYDERDCAPAGELEALRKQATAALKILGVGDVAFLGLPDQRLDAMPLLDIVKALESEVASFRPEVVYTQYGGDLNKDHEVVFRATLTAARPLPGTTVREIYAYEVPSSTELAPHDPFEPTSFVDIFDTLSLKLEAMKAYESELRPAPHPRSISAIQALAVWRGATVGLQAAEAFRLVRSVR